MPDNRPLICIIEDDRDMAAFIARLMSRQQFQHRVAHTAAEARVLFRETAPDLVVLDIDLPDGSGLDLCGELRQASNAPVLFLTGKTDVKDKVAGLGAGGDYYLTKPYDSNELLAVVKCLLGRIERTKEIINGAAAIRKGSLTLKLDEKKAYVNAKDTGLSPREFSLLLLLVQNEGAIMTYELLYESIWLMPMHGDTGALRKNLSRIKKKLDEENATDFTIYNEQGKGYIFTRV